MQGLQLAVFWSTIIIGVLSLLLAIRLTQAYLKSRSRSHLFWSAGLWIFCASVFLETIFAAGTYSAQLIDLYLFLVVALVASLSLGSIQMVKNETYKKIYYAFTVVILLVSLYAIASTDQGNLMQNYVVAGLPSSLAIIASSIATFTAAAVIVICALFSYLRKRSYKMLSIIAGVIVVSIAGSLYISSFPEFLYYSEFIGIVLLWIGFI